MRLADGTLWPIPVTLDITEEKAAEIGSGANLALRDPEGVMLGVLHVSELYRPDRDQEAKLVFGTTDRAHPGAAYLLDRSHPVYVSGELEVVMAPRPLRLQGPAADAGAAAGPFRRPELGQGGRFPDPQPHAPGPCRTDPAGGPPGGGQPSHPPVGGHDQAGRRRPPHPGAVLPGRAQGLPARHRYLVAPAPGHAHGRSPGSGVARHHPQELRRQPFHRRPGPCRTGPGLDRPAVLRAVRRPGPAR